MSESARPLLLPERASGRTIDLKELVDELREVVVVNDTISGLVLDKTLDVLQKHRELVEASIKLTYPEDWVVYPTRDGAKLCYLQDVGCQRIRGLWGISFDRTDLMRDMIEERIEAGEDVHFQYLARAGGKCSVTGEEGDELGSRLTSDGLFSKQWEEARLEPSERARLKANVRKAALANGQGRLVRKFTGMNSLPMQVLEQHGMDVARCRGIRFESGTKGGSGEGASEPQLKRLAGVACMEGKVAGLAKSQYQAVLAAIGQAQLGKKKASDLIDRLSKSEAPVEAAKFWQGVGVADPFAKPTAAPAATKAAEPPAADAWDPETQNCPACSRTPALLKSNGHAKDCPYTPGAA